MVRLSALIYSATGCYSFWRCRSKRSTASGLSRAAAPISRAARFLIFAAYGDSASSVLLATRVTGLEFIQPVRSWPADTKVLRRATASRPQACTPLRAPSVAQKGQLKTSARVTLPGAPAATAFTAVVIGSTRLRMEAAGRAAGPSLTATAAEAPPRIEVARAGPSQIRGKNKLGVTGAAIAAEPPETYDAAPPDRHGY